MIQGRAASEQSINFLCSMGLFLAGYIFYSSSLIESFFSKEFTLSHWQLGIAQACVPLGAIAGAVLAGRLADLFGRNRILVWDFLLLTLIGILSTLTFDFYSLCFMRTLNGFLAGTLYPLCAAYLIEMTADRSHARQAAFLMFINCLAAPTACIITFLLSLICTDDILWRTIAAAHVIPALFAFYWAKQLPESHEWLYYEKNHPVSWKHATSGVKILFSPLYRNMTVCLIAAWFLMDIAYYGINFFIPYLLHAMELEKNTLAGTFIINVFFMLGALTAIFIVNHVDLLKLQKYGFLFAAGSLFVLAAYFHLGLHETYIIILLFVIFNFAINIGPDVTTYLLSATSYPVSIRGSGHGLIAGSAKFGSFLGVLFLPHLQDLWGYETVILLLSILLFTAYIFTIGLAKSLMGDQIDMESTIRYETN